MRMVLVVGLLGLFGLVFWLTTKSREMLNAKPILAVDENDLGFGEMWEDPAFAKVLPIKNTTNESIEIAGFVASCSCTKIEPSSVVIPARGSADLRLTLDLRKPQSDPDGKATDFNVTIVPRIVNPTGPQSTWLVHGTVKHPCVIEPQSLDFEESLLRGKPFTPRKTTITYRFDVTELTASCDASFLDFHVTRSESNPRQFTLEVVPRSDAPSGPFKSAIALVARTPDKQGIRGAVSVDGQIRDDIGIQPECVAFGAEPLGAKLHKTITLQSRGRKSFAIQEIDKGQFKGISVDPGLKRMDGSQVLLVSLSAEGLGHREQTIHIRVTTPDGVVNIPLRIIYYGVPAQTISETK
jgi:hypothetical protein